MKKIIVGVLVICLPGSGFFAGLARDYHRQILEDLAERMQVAEEEICLQGSLMDLPLSGEQLWAGRYYLRGDGEASYAGVFSEEQEMTDYGPGNGRNGDTPVDSGGDFTAGVVYLHLHSGKILTGEQARVYLEAEWELQSRELDKLSEEAGRIDLYLYRQIIEVPATEIFEVNIWLRFKETAVLREALEAVYREYPEFNREPGDPEGVNSEIYGSGGSNELLTLPPEENGGGVDPAPSGEYGILPAPAEEINPPEGKTDTLPYITPDPHGDDVSRSRFEEMERKIAAVRLQGYQESLEQIKSELESMGVECTEPEGSLALSCALTAAQILSLKDNEYIDSVSPYVAYARDGMELAADGAFAAVHEDGAGSKHKLLPRMAAAVLLLLGGAGYYLVRGRKSRPAGEQER